MTSLAESDSVETWQKAFRSYNGKLKAHANGAKRQAKLVELDEFVRFTLPKQVASRFADEGTSTYGYMTKDEVCKIVEWKITRGKMRPLMRYARDLAPKDVEDVTGRAFALAKQDPDAAMNKLTSLRGIGPATASAILSFGELGGTCPFLSDEAMLAFQVGMGAGGKLAYTLASWQALKAKCERKAQMLNEQLDTDAEEEWTPVMIERALWAESDNKAP